jgi:hypothetical protein
MLVRSGNATFTGPAPGSPSGTPSRSSRDRLDIAP